ncbi:DNA-(apurinic or apyrimidinic site) endonuclease 2 [Denticeps clupeoides]|uniref:DNA-(apurinic or apyrimidinic site) endonuclease n=1 Tax=Denticeps clupeoides TaxID=299321 RepID=A0AAY4C610_9TELE|nr:DNA-(apurinic or apyrimidinic site) lyase 2 [Denticeps clupeoides]
MKIVTWNVNGIRGFKDGIRKTLDALDADVVCLQETKVTRDLLDERTAIVEGYSSYFSFSRGRSGYSGVATFCRESATPVAAEEGLTGLLTNHGDVVGCYGDQKDISSEELQLLDNEGRAVITQHRINGLDGPERLSVLNVYCPRADPEKPERKLFKLKFYQLLQRRAEALLESGSHVIVLGDINTSHRPIDHCDPDDIDNFEDNPGRKWLNEFLFGAEDDHNDGSDGETGPPQKSSAGGKFVDAFRLFHPTRTQAFTCWSTLTGARQTNYGTRIDYIFASRVLAETHFLGADIMPEVEGSDHCPVWGRLDCELLPGSRCPSLCTRHMPEFAGKQQKLSRFLVKVPDRRVDGAKGVLPGSQEDEEIRENLNPFASGAGGGRKRGRDGLPASSAPRGKKVQPTPRGNLLAFFKAKSDPVVGPKQDQGPSEAGGNAGNQHGVHGAEDPVGPNEERDEAAPLEGAGKSRKGACPDFWKAVLHGPPQPPLCKAHGDPCVLRTVKKAGPNMGKQFFVCARPQGHASNPEARCNFFAWVDKGK